MYSSNDRRNSSVPTVDYIKDLRARVYIIQADAYNNSNKIATHYLSKDVSIPIWGIFELFSLGEFGHFVSCFNKKCRGEISKSLGIRQTDDKNAMIPQRLSGSSDY